MEGDASAPTLFDDLVEVVLGERPRLCEKSSRRGAPHQRIAISGCRGDGSGRRAVIAERLAQLVTG
jgi:hypothetical protein